MIPMKPTSPVRLQSPLLAGLVYAFATMALAALAASILLVAGDKSEDVLPTYAYVIHGLAVVIGSFVSGRRSGSRGWYQGGLMGLFYSVIVMIVGFLSFDRGFGWNISGFVALAILVGMLGGILGVNTKK